MDSRLRGNDRQRKGRFGLNALERQKGHIIQILQPLNQIRLNAIKKRERVATSKCDSELLTFAPTEGPEARRAWPRREKSRNLPLLLSPLLKRGVSLTSNPATPPPSPPSPSLISLRDSSGGAHVRSAIISVWHD